MRTCVIDECEKVAGTARGMCVMHYTRWKRHGDVTVGWAATREEGFWKWVRKTSGCWLWVGPKSDNEYGSFRFAKVRYSAHRFSYELHKGPIPEGLHIDHLCRNRWCVNPEHLEAVTFRENVLRGIGPTAQLARQTHCKRGHPLSGENLHITKQGYRNCIACRSKKERERAEAEMSNG
jgi:HNH endonuclease